jgi:hypothetical protein
MAKVQNISDTYVEANRATDYRGYGSVSIRAHVHVNVPEGREFMRRNPTVTLERAYNVNEMEARDAAEQWRAANPEMMIRARYTVEL